jgi:two-component system, chemotaxis family, sensor kinase Cph1
MKIKSIVNTDSVTITNCESEPIHIPGSIQPHGFLLGLQKNDFTITYCSENSIDFIDKAYHELLGKNFIDIFENSEANTIKNSFSQISEELARPFLLAANNKSFHVTAHVSNETIVLEFEKFSEEKTELPDIFIQMKRFAYHTERADNLQSLCQDIADETKKITGYDRVMIYRFDELYNGEVIAESKVDSLQPFLKLHYPHTDIPVQARELYMRNLVRMLVDVSYKPVPVYTIDNGKGGDTNLDLSLSNLRSVSPIHMEYLKNMNVGATFVISLIHKKKLWGLISCHHYAPKHIPYYTRLAAHLQGIFLSSQIDVRQNADDFELAKETAKKLIDLQDLLIHAENILIEKSTLLKLKQLLNADAVIVNYRENYYTEGTLPDDKKINDLVNWLKENKGVNSFNTLSISKEYVAANDMAQTIAGLVYLPLGNQNKNCIVWTRGEVEKSINWAGDPSKAIQTNEVNKSLTPRKSFEIWKESVKLQSAAWKTPELNEAKVIASSIQHQMHLADLKSEEKRYLTLNERLQKANDELANMNWISTHDLKEPLRKIQIYGSLILENEESEIPDFVRTNITRMQTSAAKMQTLINDLLTYSKVVNEEKKFLPVDLNMVIQNLVSDLQENIEDKNVQIEIADLPIVPGVQFQLRQLFLNILSNAVKFTRPNITPKIVISIEKISSKNLVWASEKTSNSFYKISISDNGIGFNVEYKEKVFKIFQRLNSATEFMGTGIGLSICKKIAELHNGFIEATGVEGEGATFSVYLPVS